MAPNGTTTMADVARDPAPPAAVDAGNGIAAAPTAEEVAQSEQEAAPPAVAVPDGNEQAATTEDRKPPIPDEEALNAKSDDELRNLLQLHRAPLEMIGSRSDALAWLNGERVKRDVADKANERQVNGHVEPQQSEPEAKDVQSQDARDPQVAGSVTGAQVARNI